MNKEPMGDVVVVLPGILGSVLQKDGKDVWAMSAGAAFRALLSVGGSIKKLALDGDNPDIDDLGDGVTAPRMLPDLHLVPGLWAIDGYSKIIKTVTDRFDVVPGENFFEFPYDWRRDNRVHGRRLARLSHDWLTNWKDRSGNDDAKLVLVAHSMGGLVSRAFLELFDGWATTRTLITFGTPYRGSLNAVDFIASGMKRGIGPFGLDLSEFLRSLTSVHQLLPIYPCVETDTDMKRVNEIAVPHLDRDRTDAALGFHADIQSALEDRIQGDPGQRGYNVYPVVGIGQPTVQSVKISGDTVVSQRHHQQRDMSGDGTVPRVSAMPVEMNDAAAGLFSPAVHSSLQNTDAVLSQLTGILTSGQIDLGSFRSDAFGKAIGLDLPDLHPIAEPLAVVAEPAGGREVALRASITNVDSGNVAWSGALVADGDRYAQSVSLESDGIYRVTVRSADAEASDFVTVV